MVEHRNAAGAVTGSATSVAGVPGQLRGRAHRLATAVIMAGMLVVADAAARWRADLEHTSPWRPGALCLLVAVANLAVVRVRLRSAMVARDWTAAAVLVAIVAGPPGYLVGTVFLGVFAAKLVRRLPPFKAAYNAAKDALCAAAGLAVALPLGVVGTLSPVRHWPALLAIALVMEACDVLVGLPVLVLASGETGLRILRMDADLVLVGVFGKFLVGLLAVGAVALDAALLPVVVLVGLSMHLLYLGRVRARAERATWRHLAAAIDELHQPDLDHVVRSAVTGAARLFGADEVEVAIRIAPEAPLLFRADANEVTWCGPPGDAPAQGFDGESLASRLVGVDGAPDVGEIRLHFGSRVTLTEREGLTLQTFVTALGTALCNAASSAQAAGLARRYDQAALLDPLTGLANRRRLAEYGERVLGRAGRKAAALIVVDLHEFKKINEGYGHPTGDRVLVEVSRRLARLAGPADLLARRGGDEFAALLVGVGGPDQALDRAREFQAALDAPIQLDRGRIRVEARVGVATAVGAPAGDALAGGALAELQRGADQALRRAKRLGISVSGCGAAPVRSDASLLVLGGEMPRAVANHEFVVLFQPIVDLATGEMIAAEALTRWRHPDHGELDPRRFLVAVERSGQLPGFAAAVMDQALAAMLRWRALGIDAPVAINASPRSLLDRAFPALVADRLAAAGARPDDLIVELSEALTLRQLDLVRPALADLRRMGVRLALDDFGTGSSSLAMVARVPVYELKIDCAFVSAMLRQPKAAAVVRSTVELGQALALVVVAEGVEEPAQRSVLLDQGCRAGQGHLFGRPMPLDTLLESVARDAPNRPERAGDRAG
jgi:diguanylate cyclase